MVFTCTLLVAVLAARLRLLRFGVLTDCAGGSELPGAPLVGDGGSDATFGTAVKDRVADPTFFDLVTEGN